MSMQNNFIFIKVTHNAVLMWWFEGVGIITHGVHVDAMRDR